MNETTIYSFILHFMHTLKSFWFSISMQNLGFTSDSSSTYGLFIFASFGIGIAFKGLYSKWKGSA